MGKKAEPALARVTEQLLRALAEASGRARSRPTARRGGDLAALIAADFAEMGPDGSPRITAAGQAYLARRRAEQEGEQNPYRAQHLDILPAVGLDGAGARLNGSESPLAWLARRKQRDGRALISAVQLQAGERLRAEFTRAQMTPRVTSNWSGLTVQSRRAGSRPVDLADIVVAARQRVRRALAASGPEFSGLLLDVCCFLKGLDTVERERQWPARSAKIVLQLGLDRLARHYGLGAAAHGPTAAPLRAWSAHDDGFLAEDC